MDRASSEPWLFSLTTQGRFVQRSTTLFEALRRVQGVDSLADRLFNVDAAAAVVWSQKVLTANLTYYRLRRELHDEFVLLLDPGAGKPVCPISHEAFLVIRYFLTARNDSLDDNKRLSFDKAIVALRADAQRALIPPQPAAGVAGLLGFGRA